ncbi:hypothetical protein ES707_03199 [subsurface metagenome]
MSQNSEEQPVFKVGQTVWPGMANVGGNKSGLENQEEIKKLIIQLAEYVANTLEGNSIARFAFPLFRPFNAVFAITREKILAIVSPLTGGIAILRFFDWCDAPEVSMEQVIAETRQQLGWADISSFQLPRSLLNRAPLDRKHELQELAENFVERIKEQLLHQQRKVKFQPIFKTPLEDIEIDSNLCFVLMPFKPEFTRIYDDVLQPAIREAGLNSLRADEIFSPTPIVEDVWVHIGKSRLIVADVTDKNPNVFYELGLAHAIGKSVIIITQRKEDVPFDVAYIRYLIYKDNEAGWRKLKQDLTKTISSAIAG